MGPWAGTPKPWTPTTLLLSSGGRTRTPNNRARTCRVADYTTPDRARRRLVDGDVAQTCQTLYEPTRAPRLWRWEYPTMRPRATPSVSLKKYGTVPHPE